MVVTDPTGLGHREVDHTSLAVLSDTRFMRLVRHRNQVSPLSPSGVSRSLGGVDALTETFAITT